MTDNSFSRLSLKIALVSSFAVSLAISPNPAISEESDIAKSANIASTQKADSEPEQNRISHLSKYSKRFAKAMKAIEAQKQKPCSAWDSADTEGERIAELN